MKILNEQITTMCDILTEVKYKTYLFGLIKIPVTYVLEKPHSSGNVYLTIDEDLQIGSVVLDNNGNTWISVSRNKLQNCNMRFNGFYKLPTTLRFICRSFSKGA